jgi:protein O-mannosyl-transferase
LSSVRDLGSVKRTGQLYLCLLVLFALIAFYPCFNNGFIKVDDSALVYNNQKIFTLSFQNCLTYFTSFHRRLYHPLVLISYAIEFHFFGLDPAVYHATNICLHVANTLLVYAFFMVLLRRRDLSLLIALLFAVHPLRVESVAWITERKDLLFALFYLMGMVLFALYKTRSRGLFYALAWTAFIFSLLSKPMAVTLPLVFLMINFRLGGGLKKKDLIEVAPFMVVSAVFCVIALFGQRYFRDSSTFSFPGLWQNILEANYNVLLYVHKTVLPIKLSFSYPHYIKDGALIKGYIWYSPLISVFLLGAVLISLRYTKTLAYGTCFFLITLLPAMNLVPFALGTPGDRLTYIPQLGLLYAAASTIFFFSGKLNKKINYLKHAYWGVIAGLVLCLMVLTYQRCSLWKNSFLLFTNVVQTYPDSKTSILAMGILSNIYKQYNDEEKSSYYINRAAALEGNGRLSRIKLQLLSAENDTGRLSEVYKNILVSTPFYYEDLTAMKFYISNGRFDEALGVGAQALTWGSEYSWLVHRLSAEAYLRKGEYNKSIEECNASLRLNPRDYNSYIVRGVAYEKLNDLVRSKQDNSKATQLLVAWDPNLRVLNGKKRDPEVEMRTENDALEGW